MPRNQTRCLNCGTQIQIKTSMLCDRCREEEERWRQPLRDLVNVLLRHIDALSEEKRKTLYEACQKASTTNCWWIEYNLANIAKWYLEDRHELGDSTG